MSAISLKNVWERYRVKFVINKEVHWEEIWALKDINLEIHAGERVCIIGENGSGKTTLLKLIAGMLMCDKGRVEVKGRVSALLDLGSGFHPELTGRENLFLSASLFGLDKQEIEKRYEEIVDFSGIGRFINAQLKTYSQGMFVRLAFAIAIHVEPEILLIDDILAVGDTEYQRKCLKKIFELKESRRTLVLVTHDLNLASQICSRGVFLDKGKVVRDGPVKKVVSTYLERIGSKEGIARIEKGPVTAIFNNGRLFLDYQESPLTKQWGGYSQFSLPDKVLFSNSARWNIVENKEGVLIAEGEYFNTPFKEKWKIFFEGEWLKWEIFLDADEKFMIERGVISLMVSQEYERWLNSLDTGTFPHAFSHETEWEVVSQKRGASFLGLERPGGEQGEPPTSIIFKTEGQQGIETQIKSTGENLKERVLQFYLPKSEYQPGTRRYFSGKIGLFEGGLKRHIEERKREREIERDGIKVKCLGREIEIESGGERYWFHMQGKIGRQSYSGKGQEGAVKKEGETLEIEREWGGIKEKVKIEIKDGGVEYQGELEGAEEVEGVVEAGEEYKRWVTEYERGEMGGRFMWEDAGIEKKSRLWGVEKEGVVIYMEGEGEYKAEIRNSGEGERKRQIVKRERGREGHGRIEIKQGEIERERAEKRKEREEACSIERDGIKVKCLGREIEIESGGERYWFHMQGKIGRQSYSGKGQEGAVKKEGETLEIEREWGGIKEKVKIEIKDGGVEYQGELEGAEEVEGVVEAGEEYKRWVTEYERGEMGGRFMWEDAGIEKKSRLWGVEKEGVVIYMEGEGEYKAEIRNSGEGERKRQIVKRERGREGHGRIEIKQGEIERERAEKRKEREEAFSLSMGRLRVLWRDSHGIEIFFKNRLLTIDRGVYTGLRYGGRDYIFGADTGAECRVEKEGDGLKMIFQWEGTPFIQIWHISIINEETLLWKVFLNISREVLIRNRWYQLVLLNQYSHWFTTYEEGDFTGHTVHLYTNKARMVGLSSKGLPQVAMTSVREDWKGVTDIHRKAFPSEEGLVLDFTELGFSSENHFTPGEYCCFQGQISISEEKRVKPVTLPEKKKRIEAKDLAIELNGDRWKIYYLGRELTMGLGMYTSLLRERVWVDSTRALWYVKELSLIHI